MRIAASLFTLIPLYLSLITLSFKMVKLGNVDLFVVIAIVVAVTILLVIGFYLLVNYQHPDDKNEAYLPKAVVVLGFCLAGITVLMLPLDVANNEGYAGTYCYIYKCKYAFLQPPAPTHPPHSHDYSRLRRIRYQTLWWTQYESHVDHCLLDDSSVGIDIDSMDDILLRSG